MKSTSYKEYQIAPEFRRCCWYIIFGGFMFVIVVNWIARFLPDRNPEGITFSWKLFGMLAAAMAYPLRWRLRVDQTGVSRRILFWWDSWPWADLSSGRIRKLYPYTLRDPERPWWLRTLRLKYMASKDIQEVISAINMYYKLPAPPDVPPTLTIKYGCRTVTFDHNGINLMIRNTLHEYMWQDIRDIHIIRMDPLRRDFKCLLITLPDQEIELKLVAGQGAKQAWRGATAEEINEFLLQIVPTDRIHISIEGQPSMKREYIERELRKAEKMKHDHVIICVISTFLFVALLAWTAFINIYRALFTCALFFIFPGLVEVFMLRFHNKKIKNLKNMLELADDNNK
jgi:cbb3-type cytochrome oxidase subunit 3